MLSGTNIRVGIALYRSAFIPVETLEILQSLCADIQIRSGPCIAANRNACVTECKQTIQSDFGFDWFVSLDHDVQIKPKTIDNLIRIASENGISVLSSAYTHRHNPQYIHAGSWYIPGAIKSFYTAVVGEIYKVDWIGFGCCIIRSDVFRTCAYPYWEPRTIRWTHENINYSETVTADQGFCISLSENKIPIYVDTSDILGHE